MSDELETEPGLTFGDAWDIQKSVGPSLDHDPKCSSVPGHHPFSGPALLCDCGAIEREWKLRVADSDSVESKPRRPAHFYYKKDRGCPDIVVAAWDFDVVVAREKDLERKLADALEKIENTRKQLDSCHKGWRNDIQKYLAEIRRAEVMLNEAVNQRDALANAIRAFMPEFENGNEIVESLADTLFDSLKVLQGGGK